jgi:hypothetical protein
MRLLISLPGRVVVKNLDNDRVRGLLLRCLLETHKAQAEERIGDRHLQRDPELDLLRTGLAR